MGLVCEAERGDADWNSLGPKTQQAEATLGSGEEESGGSMVSLHVEGVGSLSVGS